MGIFSYLVKFFEGRVGVWTDAKNKNAFLTFLVSRGINAEITPNAEDGSIYTEISPRILKNIAPALDKLNIIVYNRRGELLLYLI